MAQYTLGITRTDHILQNLSMLNIGAHHLGGSRLYFSVNKGFRIYLLDILKYQLYVLGRGQILLTIAHLRLNFHFCKLGNIHVVR